MISVPLTVAWLLVTDRVPQVFFFLETAGILIQNGAGGKTKQKNKQKKQTNKHPVSSAGKMPCCQEMSGDNKSCHCPIDAQFIPS